MKALSYFSKVILLYVFTVFLALVFSFSVESLSDDSANPSLYLNTFLIFLGLLTVLYPLWSRTIKSPLTELIELTKKLREGYWNTETSSLIYRKDEFGSVARLLQDFSHEFQEKVEKQELILEAVLNTVNYMEEIPPFIKDILNRLNEVMNAKASLFIAEDFHRDRFTLFIASDSAAEEDIALLKEVYKERKKELYTSSEEPVCIKDLKEETVIRAVLFRLEEDTQGAVLLLFKETKYKADENYLKIICQHIISTIRLSHLATTDPLTGVPNRRILEHDIKNHGKLSKRYGKKLSLLMIDIDNFKGINDTYGHSAGDRILKEVTRLIRNNIRETDSLYRYGGEEFAVLCPETDKKGAYELAERIRENIRSTKLWVDKNTYIYITVSLGIANYPEDAEDPQELLVIADISLYKAKSAGKNRSVMLTLPQDKEIYKERFKTERDLRELILKGSTTHHLQPIYDLKKGSIYGYELLFRVIKEGEAVPIGRFLKDIEDLSIMEDIDMITIRYLKRIIKDRKLDPFCFFINISPRSLERGKIIEELSTIPKHIRSRIFIEITERETFLNIESALSYLDLLKDRGFKIAMDDFGSGFSTILQMRYFVKFIDLLKIDGILVRNVSRDPYNRVILESLKTMADRFSIDLVAEFIESEKDLETVKKIGIRFGQGYYLKEDSYRLKFSPR